MKIIQSTTYSSDAIKWLLYKDVWLRQIDCVLVLTMMT